MNHWLAIIGACLALAGSLILGFDLWKSKDDEADEAAFRADQDKIDGINRGTIIALWNALSDQGQFLVGYLRNLEVDLEPVFKPLLEDGGSTFSKENLELGILGRHVATEGLAKAQQVLAGSIDPERALLLVQEAQRRIEKRFIKQQETALRMRTIARWGVVLVGVGALAQLLDTLLHSLPM